MGAMTVRNAAWRVLAVLSAPMGCSDPAATDAGILGITTTTSGPSQDADGYVVRLDGQTARRAAATDTVVVLLTESATHTVVLGEVAQNCSVEGDSVRSIPVPKADTAWVSFDVTCSGAIGALRVTTTATGAELDPNGFELSVPGFDQPVVLRVNGVFSTGQYTWMPVWLPELYPTRMRATAMAFVFNGPRFIACFGPLVAGTMT